MADGAVSLAIALAAGFFLVERTYLTEFQVRRSEAQRLIFLSTVAALVLMIASRFILAAFSCVAPAGYSLVRSGWTALMPRNTPSWLGTAAVALGLTILIPSIVNRRWPRHEANLRAIRDCGSNFEKLMVSAFDRQIPIAVTLKSRKVYVGRISRLPSLLDVPRPSDVRMLPYLSGYRRADDFGYVFTTGYAAVYQRILNTAEQSNAEDAIFRNLNLDDFEIVIPVAEITTAHLFDRALYARHASIFSLPQVVEASR